MGVDVATYGGGVVIGRGRRFGRLRLSRMCHVLVVLFVTRVIRGGRTGMGRAWGGAWGLADVGGLFAWPLVPVASVLCAGCAVCRQSDQ